MASALVPIILSSCSPGLYQGQFTKTRMQNKNPKVDSPLTWSGLVCYQKEFDNCFGANCPNRLLHLVWFNKASWLSTNQKDSLQWNNSNPYFDNWQGQTGYRAHLSHSEKHLLCDCHCDLEVCITKIKHYLKRPKILTTQNTNFSLIHFSMDVLHLLLLAT